MNTEQMANLSPDYSADAVMNMTKITLDPKGTITSEESTSSMTLTTELSTATASRCLTSLLDMNEGYEMVIWDLIDYE